MTVKILVTAVCRTGTGAVKDIAVIFLQISSKRRKLQEKRKLAAVQEV
ncbi:MAG: hypothetical protein UFD80_12560 [Blautia sp.]|nr:hypothetical protein [Blautia sp.]